MCDNICRCRNKMDERKAVRCWGEEKWPTPLCQQQGVDPTGRMVIEVTHPVSPSTPSPLPQPHAPSHWKNNNKYKFCNTVLNSSTFKFIIENFWFQIFVVAGIYFSFNCICMGRKVVQNIVIEVKMEIYIWRIK